MAQKNKISYEDLYDKTAILQGVKQMTEEMLAQFKKMAAEIKKDTANINPTAPGAGGNVSEHKARLQAIREQEAAAKALHAETIRGLKLEAEKKRLQEASNKEAKTTKAINESAADSYLRLQKQLKDLVAQWKAGSNELRSQLQPQIKATNEQLKQMDATLGNHQRNVGDYRNAITDSLNSLTAFKARIKEINNELNKPNKSPDEIKKLQKELGKTMNDMKDFRNAIRGMEVGEILPNWIKFGRGVAGTMATGSAAMSLFTKDSEQLKQVEARTIQVISALQGLSEIQELVESGTLKNIASFLKLDKVMAALGSAGMGIIGIVAAGITMLVAAFAELSLNTESAAEKQERLNKAYEDKIKLQDKMSADAKRVREESKLKIKDDDFENQRLAAKEEYLKKISDLETTLLEIQRKAAGDNFALGNAQMEYDNAHLEAYQKLGETLDEISKKEKEFNAKRAEELKKATDAWKKANEELLAHWEEVYATALDMEHEDAEKRLKIKLEAANKYWDEQRKLDDELLKEQEKIESEKTDNTVSQLKERNTVLTNAHLKRLDEIDEEKKAREDLQNKIVSDAIEAANMLKEISQQESDEKIAQYDRQISAAEKSKDQMMELAQKGYLEASQSIMEQERIRAEAEKKKMEEQIKQRRQEAAISAFAGYAQHAKAGDKNAAMLTMADIAAIYAFTKTLAKGEIDISSPIGVEGKDSIPAVLMPGESVITTAATRRYKPALEAMQENRYDEYIQNQIKWNPKVLQGGGDMVVQALSVKLDKVVEAIESKPVHQVTVDAMDVLVERKLEKFKNTVKHYEHSKGGLF